MDGPNKTGALSIARRLEDKVEREMLKMLDDTLGMPTKGSKNNMTGTYTRTQYDVEFAFKAWAKRANAVYVTLTGSDMSIWDAIQKLAREERNVGFFDDE